ncbi:MAG TPA: hypothetical protein VFW62_08455, partial [bacterium]|nr:hypothetical protein [bacterium]
MMEGTFYGFCQGQNPELCNTVGEGVYEFSNQGYGMLVVTPSDRFLLQDLSVKTAYGCVQKKPEVALPLDSLSISSSTTLLEGKSFVPQVPPAPDYQDRLFPDDYPDRLPPFDVVEVPPENPPPQVEAAPVAELPKTGNAVQPQAPSPKEPEPIEAPKAGNSEQESVEAAVVANAVENSSAGSSGAGPVLAGGACSLQAASPAG